MTLKFLEEDEGIKIVNIGKSFLNLSPILTFLLKRVSFRVARLFGCSAGSLRLVVGTELHEFPTGPVCGDLSLK